MAIDRREWLSIKQNSYRKSRIAINRGEKLSIEEDSYQQRAMLIEQKSYGWNRKAIDRRKWLLIEQNGKAIDRTEKLSIEENGYR